MRYKSAWLIGLAISLSLAVQLQGQGGPSAGAASTSSVMPYARYRTPALCLEAMDRMKAFYWRDKRADTVMPAPLTDSLPAMVRDSLRQCAERFTPSTVAVAELVPLVQLALVIGDTMKATAAVSRAMSALPTMPSAMRSWTMENLGLAYLEASPSRVADARQYAKRLDAIGAVAAYERFSLHRHIARFAMSVGALAIADSESHASTEAVKELEHSQQINLCDSIIGAYMQRARIISLYRGTAPALAFLDTANTVITPFTQNGTEWAPQVKGQLDNGIMYYRMLFSSVGKPAKLVRGEYWMPLTPGDTVFPKARRVTVTFLASSGMSSFDIFAAVKRLHDSYAARGLDIVFMTTTVGSFRGSVEPDPVEEVNRIRSFFVDFVKLPAAFVVEEAQFGRLPDGRRQNAESSNFKNYRTGAGATIVGKDGTFKLALDLSLATEVIYRQKIEAALAE